MCVSISINLSLQVAYKQASKELMKWQPAVAALHRAEHIAFPLAPPEVPTPSTNWLVNPPTAPTDMEGGIADILRMGGVDDEAAIAECETLSLRQMSPEEAALRFGDGERERERECVWEGERGRKEERERERESEGMAIVHLLWLPQA